MDPVADLPPSEDVAPPMESLEPGPPLSPEKEKPSLLSASLASLSFPIPTEETFVPRLKCRSAEGALGTANYTRGVFFSPDGLCVLALASDHTLRLSELPCDNPAEVTPVSPCFTMRENETVYDAAWYPPMDSSKPETCCFAVTAHAQPIHLYDAFDGSIRATYRCFNHLDELATAHSLAFDFSGARLYAGMKNELRVFDVAVSGKACETRKTWSKKEGGQAGIISTIATNPVLENVYAVGTFARTVGVYLEGQTKTNNHLLCLLEGQVGGITQLKFSGDGNFLLAGGRKDNEILVWDMRNPGSLYATLPRVVGTNQRVHFDIHPVDQRTVVTGNTDGTVRLFDLTRAPAEEGAPLQPVWTGKGLHNDCINGVSFHPYRPLLATSSGQRRVRKLAAEFIDSDEEEMEECEKDNLTPECLWKVWDFEKVQSDVV